MGVDELVVAMLLRVEGMRSLWRSFVVNGE
jgi:hypothetical protein